MHTDLAALWTDPRSVPTPSLVIDEPRLDRNISAMAAFASRAGLGLSIGGAGDAADRQDHQNRHTSTRSITGEWSP